jgi:D-3-phosphoglycerate dehydrogenase
MNTVLITTSSFDKAGEALVQRIASAGFMPILNPFKRRLSESEAAELIREHRPVGMIAGVEPLTRSVLNTGAQGGLKVVSRCGIGMDSVDLEAAQDNAIDVMNTPDGPTRAVAELVLGQMIGLLRGIQRSDASIRSGGWERPMGRLLYGKQVGLIGCGRIGNMVAHFLTPFGCSVVGTDPFNHLENLGRMVSFDALIETSDIVSLHVPYSESNRNLIGSKQLAQMKPGSFLINSARGGLVDESALAQSILSEHLGGAAVDTFCEEPYSGELMGLKNVILTGHIGSYAKESRAIMERDATNNLIAALSPQTPTNESRRT